jgi:hypothetical protein
MTMAKLVFKNDKNDTLIRMMEFSNKHKRKIPYFDKYTKDYGFWLVKDEGIYLMSPTKEKFVLNDAGVVYADGFNPDSHDVHQRAQSVSRDDFAEFIPVTAIQKKAVLEGRKITINLTETEIEVTI